MRKLTLTLAGAVALMGCTVVKEVAPQTTAATTTTTTDAPIATAPAQTEATLSPVTKQALFIANIESVVGVVWDEETTLETGYMICDVLLTGSGTLEDVVLAVLDASITPEDVEFGTAVVASALVVLCPEMAYLLDELN